MTGRNDATMSKRASFAERGHDLYETPAVATHALLDAVPIPHRVWEPACGPGAMVRVLRQRGHEVYASDLVDYGWDGQNASGWDFLRPDLVYPTCDAIVTNPPFRHAEDFVRLALVRAPMVAMLLRLAFLESERRTGLLENGMLASVHVFAKRLPMMHRAGWEGRKANSGMAFAWFIWRRDHVGPTTVGRLHWDASARSSPKEAAE